MTLNIVDKPLRQGDLCHHGDNTYPVYQVIFVHDGRAWVRDVSSGVEGIVDVDRCRPLSPEHAMRLETDLRRAADLPAPDHGAPMD
jgi:hypothetical protein